jgi:hypothetical protein
MQDMTIGEHDDLVAIEEATRIDEMNPEERHRYMTLAERSKLEANVKTDRAVSRGTDGAVRRDDNGRTCGECRREFRPVDGNKYCGECQKGRGW